MLWYENIKVAIKIRYTQAIFRNDKVYQRFLGDTSRILPVTWPYKGPNSLFMYVHFSLELIRACFMAQKISLEKIWNITPKDKFCVFVTVVKIQTFAILTIFKGTVGR